MHYSIVAVTGSLIHPSIHPFIRCGSGPTAKGWFDNDTTFPRSHAVPIAPTQLPPRSAHYHRPGHILFAFHLSPCTCTHCPPIALHLHLHLHFIIIGTPSPHRCPCRLPLRLHSSCSLPGTGWSSTWSPLFLVMAHRAVAAHVVASSGWPPPHPNSAVVGGIARSIDSPGQHNIY